CKGRADRALFARQAVHETRLAHVGPPGQDDVNAAAQQAALPAPAQDLLERGAHARKACGSILDMETLDLFFRKIEHRLNERAQLDELGAERADRCGELPLERAQRAARRLAARRIDQVGDRLGLRQIELALEKGAPREL